MTSLKQKSQSHQESATRLGRVAAQKNILMQNSNAIVIAGGRPRRSILTAPFRRAWRVLGKAAAVDWTDAALDVAAVLVAGFATGIGAWALGKIAWTAIWVFWGYMWASNMGEF